MLINLVTTKKKVPNKNVISLSLSLSMYVFIFKVMERRGEEKSCGVDDIVTGCKGTQRKWRTSFLRKQKITFNVNRDSKKGEKPYKNVCTCCVIKKNLRKFSFDKGSGKKSFRWDQNGCWCCGWWSGNCELRRVKAEHIKAQFQFPQLSQRFTLNGIQND